MASSPQITLPVSQLQRQTDLLFDSLLSDEPVFVTRHGRIVAVFEPASSLPPELLAVAAVTGHEHALSAGSIGQGSPTAEIDAASEGHPTLVTKGNRIAGVLRAARAQPVTDEVVELAFDRDRAIEQFVAEHPDATALEIAQFTSDHFPSPEPGATDDHRDKPEERATATSEEAEHILSTFKARWIEQGSYPASEDYLKRILEHTLEADGLPEADWSNTQGPVAFRKLLDGDRPPYERLIHKAHVATQRGLVGEARLLNAIVSSVRDRSPAVAFWRLGDLSRSKGYSDEATIWYSLAEQTDKAAPLYRIAQSERTVFGGTLRLPASAVAGDPIEIEIQEWPGNRKRSGDVVGHAD